MRHREGGEPRRGGPGRGGHGWAGGPELQGGGWRGVGPEEGRTFGMGRRGGRVFGGPHPGDGIGPDLPDGPEVEFDRGPGPGFGRGPGTRRGRGGPAGPRGRAQRGDVRTAILLLLAEQPMHGYQLMQAIGDRTGGAWRVSAGAVYPTIAQLEDEGLVTVRADGGRRLVTITDAGRDDVAERSARSGDPFQGFADAAAGPDLRAAVHELGAAARQISVNGTAEHLKAAQAILMQARRSLYLILAGESIPSGESTPGTPSTPSGE